MPEPSSSRIGSVVWRRSIPQEAEKGGVDEGDDAGGQMGPGGKHGFRVLVRSRASHALSPSLSLRSRTHRHTQTHMRTSHTDTHRPQRALISV